MSKILRWTGYATTTVGAILIILYVIGGLCYHKSSYPHPQKEKCCVQHKVSCDKDVAKTDSACYKHQEHAVAMADSAMQKPCCTRHEAMSEKSCTMEHRQGNPLELAIALFLLSISLFMISKHCCCKDSHCDCKEEKKEA
jgi:hypothetical protein